MPTEDLVLLERIVDAAGDCRELLTAATRAVATLFGERGSCILLEGGAHVAVSTYTPALTQLPIDLKRYPEMLAAIDRRAVVVVEDVWADSTLDTVRALLPDRLRSITAVPLCVEDQVLGVITAVSSGVRSIDEGAIATAALIGKLTARLLKSAAGSTSNQFPMATDPRTPTKALAPARSKLPAAARSASPRRLLIVDDDQRSLGELAALLEEEGYRVECAHDGREGLERARAALPDLILLDVNMPVLDGLSAAEQLRADPLTAETPLLFLSGSDDLMVRIRGFKLGAADFVSKPVFAEELLVRVERSLGLVEVQERLRQEANVDALTGLGNLRFLKERLAIEEARWQRYGFPVAALMIDVDKLKQLNDQHGHAAGSEVLAAIGRVLRAQTREADVAVRYGGDEYVVLLPHATSKDALSFAERVLVSVRAIEAKRRVSVSIGVASSENDAQVTGDELLRRADIAAYQAKRKGGDCVCAYDSAANTASAA